MPQRLFLAFCAFAAVAGCTRGQADTPAKPAGPPRYAAMARGLVDVDGGVLGITATRDGRVTEVPVAEGDTVNRGDLLLQLDTGAADLAVATAQAEVAQAQAQLAALDARLQPAERRAERLDTARKEGLATGQAADDAGAQLAGQKADRGVAQASLELARQHLRTAQWEREQRSLRAPASGKIARRAVSVGSLVGTTPATELFVLIPQQALIVHADLEQDFADRVKAGMNAEVIDEMAPEKVYPASVLRMGAMFAPRANAIAGERQDVRVLDCVLALKDAPLRVGQRVLVRFPAQK
jgi:RND family efflux transporter MFP subunit